MFDEEKVKQEIKILVDKYNRLSDTGKIKNYNEERTKAEFIEPLFETLGWDVRNKHSDDEVTREEKVSKGRVDYAFRIDGIPKFFLEAKKPKEDLDNQKHVKQAIDYAWHKGCTWAILTNFESIKIFNAEVKNINPLQSQFGQTFFFYDFLNNFDQIWLLLSRESFKEGLIDKEAEKWGKKAKKVPVDKQLLNDLTNFRELLSKNILKNNSAKNLSGDDLDETVQRILDRLIFIRTLEDKQLEAPILQALIREDQHKRVYAKLNSFFRRIDEEYNSKIFAPHLCEEVVIDNEILEKIIRGLFKTSDNTVHYNFGAIDADVLGNMYEQYLGHILKKTDKRAKLTEGKAHRKEQGIYYTPTYIVDYIVKNTIGELAKNKKFDLSKIKVLDPACGSGSFLIKTVDYLIALEKNRNGNVDQTKLDLTGASATYGKKIEILKNNIFGVDLDPKAVEIAQLNLLLKAAEKKHRLPTLQENIKIGNSLIDDEEIVGNKAFKWEEQFKEIIEEGGFDVVIGNPPYIRIQTLDKNQVEYFNRKYESPTKNYDIYLLFIEKGFKLLKENGILGLILPHKFFQGESGEKIRKFISERKALHRIVDFGTNQIFEDAATYTCLLFLQKKNNREFYYKGFKLGDNFKNLIKAKYEKKSINILKDEKWNFSSQNIQKILKKIKSYEQNFRDITKKIFKGSSTGNDDIFLLDLIKKSNNKSLVFSNALNKEIELENDVLHPFVYGKDIRRYGLIKNNKLLLFPYLQNKDKTELIPLLELQKYYPKTFMYLNSLKDELLKRKLEIDNKNFYKYSAARSLSEYNQPKIMIPDMLVSNRISIDEKGIFYHGPAIHSIVFNDKVKNHSQHFYLGILNSSLFWFFISNTSTALRGDTYRLTPEFLSPFCFPKIDKKNEGIYYNISDFVKQMLKFTNNLSEIDNKQTDEKARLEKQIQKIDDDIDQSVYKLYGITKEEQEIIEESLK
ncbi:N-6 DNA methylase [Candidatus Woesearchaeota archaeon]|nr:N-6 DNA methylase [Candidatus Woesearchaeota archaeon]